MTLLLYAVIPVDARVPDGFSALHGNRAAILHAEQEPGPTADHEAVLAFGRAIETIAREVPALPMRFGTTAADLMELRLLIAENEEMWAARLEAVAGCCELIVHVAHSSTAGRDAALDELRAVLSPWLREARWLAAAGPDRMAVLVPVDQASSARARLEQWAVDRPGLEIAVTGPWPPFDFCSPAA